MKCVRSSWRVRPYALVTDVSQTLNLHEELQCVFDILPAFLK